jgi:Fe2+ or Zn2+ uptake regulation protein
VTRTDDVHGRIRQFLVDHDIRYTRGRQAVVRSLERAGGPRSAAELHSKLRSVPLSSLYRSLAILDEAGVLRKHHDADGLARFELAEWLGGHHHHLVCVECGEVEDIDLGEESESELRRIAARMAAEAGYRSTGHVLEVEGLCSGCRR